MGRLAAGAIVLIIIGSAIYAQSTAQPLTPSCVTDEDRVHIRAQVLEAVDSAFKDNVKHLFTGWLKDPHQQPDRASAGLQASIVAYQRARQDALKWSPTSC
jgi:hypothetical protein